MRFRIGALTTRTAAWRPAPGVAGPDERVAIVLGSEGPGLGEATLAAADVLVRIPMARGVDSLNVATAGAIAFAALGWHPGTGNR
jgi:tRNA G18 (ribose-2'-O)-methylase SpoU